MKRKVLLAVLTLLLSIADVVSLVYPQRAGAQESKPGAIEVKVDNFTFNPQTLTVPANSTVIWTNKDDIPHTIVSQSGLFKSKALDTDQGYSYTFTKAGTYEYFCGLHPKMVGKIVVQ